jgi:rubredoxin
LSYHSGQELLSKRINKMKRYLCEICGFIYDESVGIPEEGIAPGTPFAEIPDDWVCSDCGATKASFILIEG